MTEKIIKYEVKLVVNHHTNQHIKKFENILLKMVNTTGLPYTSVASVKQIK